MGRYIASWSIPALNTATPFIPLTPLTAAAVAESSAEPPCEKKRTTTWSWPSARTTGRMRGLTPAGSLVGVTGLADFTAALGLAAWLGVAGLAGCLRAVAGSALWAFGVEACTGA